MKFGKLEDITGVDFKLPNDHSVTRQVLTGNPVVPKVLVGGTMWNIPDWIGKIFPEKMPKKELMRAYGSAFGTIELNATHYKIPEVNVVKNWYDVMPDDFLFCPKFPQLISHYRRFNNSDGLTDEFLSAILNLKEKLSFSFIQLPPNFTSQKAADLERYLRSLPSDMKFALEFRHDSWFDGNSDAESTWTLMKDLGITAVISDTAGRRDAVHMRLTTPHCIVRFGGNEMHETDISRLNDWMDRIELWAKSGLQEFHFWIHQSNSIKTPETALFIQNEMKNRMNIRVKAPVFVSQQKTLF